MTRLLLGICCWILTESIATAQSVSIQGVVLDAHTLEPIPYGSVYLKQSKLRKTTDSIGRFVIQFHATGFDSLQINCVGYEIQTIRLDSSSSSTLQILLNRNGVNQEVVFSVKYDKGLQAWRRIMKNKKYSDRYGLINFSYEAYHKLEVDVQNLNEAKVPKNIFFRPFSFIFNTILSLSDSSENLPAYLMEGITEYAYQRQPKKDVERTRHINARGAINPSGVNVLNMLNQKIDIFSNYIQVGGQDFISPFHEQGDRFYSFYVPESQSIDGEKTLHFVFKPKQPGSNTFTGDAWVLAKNHFIQSITLYLNAEASINYIDRLSIFQAFAPLNDSVNFLSRDKIYADFKIAETDKLTVIARKTTSYRKVKYNNDSITGYFSTQAASQLIQSDKMAHTANEKEWEAMRHDSLSAAERRAYITMDSIIANPKYVSLQNTFKFLISGYKDIGPLEIGRWHRLYSYNIWEGHRLQIDLGTNKNFSKNVHLHGYLAYGTNDKNYKGLLEAFWILRRKPNWSKLNVRYSSDINNGINTTYSENQNMLFAPLFRKPNISGRRFMQFDNLVVDYFKEWGRGFSTQFFVSKQQFTPLLNLPAIAYFPVEKGRPLTTVEIALKLRFAYQESFLENNYTRRSLRTPYPVFEFQMIKGIPSILQSAYRYTKTSLSVQGELHAPPLQTFHYRVFGGKIDGTVPFTFLENHAGNDFYMYNPEGYNLMNCFQYLSDRYAGAQVEHSIGAGLFRFVPITRRWKLRQFWNAKALWGSLSEANKRLNSAANYFTSLNNSTYLELGTGIDNILRLFRIDFVWRVLPQPLPAERVYRFGAFWSLHFQL